MLSWVRTGPEKHVDERAGRPIPRGRRPMTVHGEDQSNFDSPRDAIEAGIGMVHQHFMLVPSQKRD